MYVTAKHIKVSLFGTFNALKIKCIMYNAVLDYHKGTISKCIFAFWVDLEKQKFETASHDQI